MITENLSDVVWIYNATQQRFTYFSPSITQIRGFSVEEAQLKSPDDFHPPETVAFLKQAINDAVAEFGVNSVEPKNYYYEVQAISKEGENEILGISRNTDQRKKAEIAILGDQILLRTSINNIPNPIYIKDKEGRKILANSPDLEVMGFTSEDEVLGKTDLELYHEDDKKDGFNQDMEVLAKERSIINQEVFLTIKKGKHIVVKADNNLCAFADQESVKLIILNLFSNAITFTPNNGLITVSANERGNMTEVSIRDSGFGMKKEMVGNLFKNKETKPLN